MHTDTEETTALRARIRDLEAALGQKDQNLAVTFRLTPKLSDLFGLMLALPNVTSEMICQRLEISSEPKVAVHRLRKMLAPLGVTINTQRNLGYWIDAEDKDKIRRLLSDTELEADDELAPLPAG